MQLAAGKISEEHLLTMRDLFPNAVLHKGYGMTETIRTSMISSLDPHFSVKRVDGPSRVKKFASVTKAAKLPTNEPGEIHVRLGPHCSPMTTTPQLGAQRLRLLPHEDLGYAMSADT